jgi:hypothetical protein
MANHEKPTQNKGEALAPLIGIAALAGGLEVAMTQKPHFTGEKLPEPIKDTFGVHNYRKTMIKDGGRAGIQELLDDKIDPNRTLKFIVITSDGVEKEVGIGRITEDIRAGREIDPDREYLMLIRDGDDETVVQPHYLSSEQLSGVTIAPDDRDVQFNSDSPDGTFLRFPGKIENIRLLEDRQ